MTERIFIIDDHPVIATGLRLALGVSDAFEFCGSAVDQERAVASIEAMEPRRRPQVVIVDLVLDGGVDFAALRELRLLLPDAALIAYSSLPEEAYASVAKAAGADAYVSKRRPLEYLLEILATLRAPANATVKRHATCADLDGERRDVIFDGVALTPREYEVCRHLADGASLSEIADSLNVSLKTVAAHRENVRRKLGCRTSSELLFRLVRLQRRQEAP